MDARDAGRIRHVHQIRPERRPPVKPERGLVANPFPGHATKKTTRTAVGAVRVAFARFFGVFLPAGRQRNSLTEGLLQPIL
jgi:hypothetical protein